MVLSPTSGSLFSFGFKVKKELLKLLSGGSGWSGRGCFQKLVLRRCGDNEKGL